MKHKNTVLYSLKLVFDESKCDTTYISAYFQICDCAVLEHWLVEKNELNHLLREVFGT